MALTSSVKINRIFAVFLMNILTIPGQGSTESDGTSLLSNASTEWKTTTDQLITQSYLNMSPSTHAQLLSSSQPMDVEVTTGNFTSLHQNTTSLNTTINNGTTPTPNKKPVLRNSPLCYHPDIDFYSYQHKPRTHAIIACQLILSTIVAVVGVFGSIMSIIVLSREKRKNTSIIFLITMAVSDLLYLLVYLVFEPVYVAYFFTNITNRLDPTLMEFMRVRHLISNGFLVIFGLISTWLVVCLTIDRFIAIRFPFLAPILCTVRCAVIEVMVTCIVSVGISVTKFLELVPALRTHPCTLELTYTQILSDLLKNKAYTLGYNVIFFAIIRNFLPVVLVVVMNALLIFALRAASKRRVEMSGDKDVKANDNNITLVLIIVATVFLICIIPGLVSAILTMCYTWKLPFTKPYQFRIAWDIIVSIGRLLTVINSSCNFFIYCAVRKGFRVTLIRMICGAESKYLPSTTSTSTDTVSTTVSKAREQNGK